jgi:O-antigen/teichoic acid export membrane protein
VIPSRLRGARRLGVMTVDQVLVGASNVLISFLAAHLLGVAAFGAFGVVFIVYSIVQGISRALATQPMLVHPDEVIERPAQALGAAVVLTSGLGVVLALAAIPTWMWERDLGACLLVLAAATPLLGLQDAGRFLGFTLQRPERALVLDVVWVGLNAAALALLVVTGRSSLVLFVAAWVGSGAVSGLLVLAWRDTRKIRASLAWTRQTWSLSWRYLVSFMLAQFAVLAAVVLLRELASPVIQAGVMGAMLLLRPFQTFQIAIVTSATTDISRSLGDPVQIRQKVVRATTITTVIALVNGLVLVLLPDSVGRLVLGDVWQHADPLLLAAGAQIVCLGLWTGIRSGLTGMRAVKLTLRLETWFMPFLLVASVIGTLVGGGPGYMWSVVIGYVIGLAVWWGFYRRVVAHPAAWAV